MAEFRLSERAESDLIAIYDYTEQTFGSYQAEAYFAGLTERSNPNSSSERLAWCAQIARLTRAGFHRPSTSTLFAGMTKEADAGKPCIGGPSATTAPPFPATHGFGMLS